MRVFFCISLFIFLLLLPSAYAKVYVIENRFQTQVNGSDICTPQNGLCNQTVGGGATNPFDQDLNTTDSVQFVNTTLTNELDTWYIEAGEDGARGTSDYSGSYDLDPALDLRRELDTFNGADFTLSQYNALAMIDGGAAGNAASLINEIYINRADTIADARANSNLLQIDGAGTVTAAYGGHFGMYIPNGGDITTYKAISTTGSNINSGTTIGTHYAHSDTVVNFGTYTNYYGGVHTATTNLGTITNWYGNYIKEPLDAGAGTTTNLYGVYCEDLDTGSNDNYCIYSLGGENFFQAGTSAQVPMTLKGAAAQSANLFLAEDSSGTDLVAIAADGDVGIGDTTPDAKLDVQASAGTVLTLTNNGANDYMSGGEVSTEFRFMDDEIWLIGVGAEATPSYSFFDDSNTGMFQNGSDTLSFSTGGRQAVTIDSGGDLGIGTNAPTYELSIVGDDASVFSQILNTDSSSLGAFWGLQNDNVEYYNLEGGYMFFFTHPTPGSALNRLTIEPDGDIGIGDSTPDAQLDIQIGTATEKGLIIQGAAGQSANIIEAQDSASNVLFSVTRQGKVGIGTDNPIVEFQIASTFPRFRFNETDNDGWQFAVQGNEWRFTDLSSGLTPFKMQAGAVANTLVVNSSSRIGIGTTKPVEKLDLHGAAAIRGDLYFIGDGTGLHFGEIYLDGGDSDVVVAAQDTLYQVTSFNATGESNGITPSHANDDLTIDKAGRYLISLNIAAYSSQSNDYEFQIMKNNGATDYYNCHLHRTTSVAGAIGSASVTCIIDLNAADTVEVWVQRNDGGAISKTISLEHINLVATMIGG